MISPSIQSFDEFSDRLQKAKQAIAVHLKEMPDDSTLLNLAEQLAFAEEKTRNGLRPTAADLSRLNFGMVAARELSDIDESLTAELAALNVFLDQAKY